MRVLCLIFDIREQQITAHCHPDLSNNDIIAGPKVNVEIVRNNEIETLIGSDKKLFSLIGKRQLIPIEDAHDGYLKQHRMKR